MPLFDLNINDQNFQVETDADTPLLWVLRDHLKLVGTKFGCGKGVCGCCTVHIDGVAARSCSTPVSTLSQRKIRTIEGLSENGYTAVQEAWKEIDAPQCGYCHSGQIMSATTLLEKNPEPSKEEIRNGMSANICRCASYNSIEKAVEKASDILKQTQN